MDTAQPRYDTPHGRHTEHSSRNVVLTAHIYRIQQRSVRTSNPVFRPTFVVVSTNVGRNVTRRPISCVTRVHHLHVFHGWNDRAGRRYSFFRETRAVVDRGLGLCVYIAAVRHCPCRGRAETGGWRAVERPAASPPDVTLTARRWRHRRTR
ncbi:unnamed protein product, partial [Iphiclides podalirius]